MKSLDCQHCGAKLALDTTPLPAEVRCRRCGRRTSTAGAKPLRPARPGTGDPVPTVPHAAPPPATSPRGFGFGNERRVEPEDIAGAVRPRPDFFKEESVIPRHRGQVALLSGGVVGVLAILAGTVWWLQTSQDGPAIGPTAYVGEPPIVAFPPPRGVTDEPRPPAAPPAAASAGAAAPPGRGAANNPPSPSPKPATPPAPTNPASLADAIEADASLCNENVFLSSELALRGFEHKFQRLAPEQYESDLRAIVADSQRQSVGAFQLLEGVRYLAADTWIKRHRPTMVIRFRSSLKAPVGAVVRVACKDAVGRELFDGGVASPPNAKVEWDGDGNAGLALALALDPSKIYDLQAPATVTLEFQIEYEDKSRELPIKHRIRVHPVGYVELLYPFAYSFASIVDEDHPMVKDLINKLSGSAFCRRTGVTLGGGGVDLPALFVVWRELKARGIRYSSITETSTPLVQEVRSLGESLQGGGQGHANCADGSVLMASIFQKLGAGPMLVMVPRHMFIMFKCDDVKYGFIGLETTALQHSGVPSKEFADFARDRLGTGEFERKLSGRDLADWRAFLAAVQSGTDAIHSCAKAMTEGLKPGMYISYPEGTEPAKARLAELEEASQKGDSELVDKKLQSLGNHYLSYCDISDARRDGVIPIGHNPKSLPKDLAGPLKAP
jgi:hypothetical protein